MTKFSSTKKNKNKNKKNKKNKKNFHQKTKNNRLLLRAECSKKRIYIP